MANLHKRSVQEALNATVGGTWTVNSAAASGSSADVANTVHVSLAATTATIAVYSSVALYFNFAASETSVNASNDMIIPKETMMFFTVPRGLGNTVYFNHNSTTTSTGSVRIVEI